MYERLKNIFNSPVSVISMMALLCCVITFNVLLQSQGEMGAGAATASLSGMVILVAWLVWAGIKLAKGRRVKEMPEAARNVIARISFLFSLCWLLTIIFPDFVRPWCIAIIWAAFVACAVVGLLATRKIPS